MTIHLRADRAVFRFSGPDAHKLLNDVVTGAIPNGPGEAAWWALLSPQGKILAEGLAGFSGDALWLDVHAGVADDFFKRMRMYKLRANMSIEDLRQTHRIGYAATPEGAICHPDRRATADLGYRVIGTLEDGAGWSADDRPHARVRIAEAIAELGPDFAPDTSFAHDIGMDQLGGIDFSKGCYVGQEVVSRMKHRGTARRRPVVVSGLDAGDAGQPILANGRDSGVTGRVVDGQAVGIVRLDRFGSDGAASVGGKPVTLTLPAWAGYRFGEVAEEA